MAGVLKQHRDRMENDPAYRKAALSINPDGAGGAALGKHLASDAPTSLSVDQGRAGTASGRDRYDELSGDELEQAVRDADIEGRSTMTADEKRAALREAAS